MARTERLGRFHRRHGTPLGFDRTELEAEGWRTTLDYRENHVRGRDGRLSQLRVVWRAEAERDGPVDGPTVVSATAPTIEKVWSRLRTAADLADLRADDRRDAARVVTA